MDFITFLAFRMSFRWRLVIWAGNNLLSSWL